MGWRPPLEVGSVLWEILDLPLQYPARIPKMTRQTFLKLSIASSGISVVRFLTSLNKAFLGCGKKTGGKLCYWRLFSSLTFLWLKIKTPSDWSRGQGRQYLLAVHLPRQRFTITFTIFCFQWCIILKSKGKTITQRCCSISHRTSFCLFLSLWIFS